MGAVTEHAAAMVTALLDAGARRVSTDTRGFTPPGLLVVPVPSYTFDSMCSSAVLTWSVVAIGVGPGDAADAATLEEMVTLVASVLPIETADPGSYQLDTQSEPKPAYTMRVTETLEL